VKNGFLQYVLKWWVGKKENVSAKTRKMEGFLKNNGKGGNGSKILTVLYHNLLSIPIITLIAFL
jgi:hypothetical protein